MKPLLDRLRERKDVHKTVRIIYGKTIGFWFLKEMFAKYIGFCNGNKQLKLLDNLKSDTIIAKSIKAGKPLMVARYGSTEFRNLFSKDEIGLLCRYSGFFPNQNNLLEKFRDVYLRASRSIDILIIWNYKNHFVNKIALLKKLPNIKNIVPLFAAGPFNCSWLNELKGKKVLVIHPFKKTIEHQYKKRAKLGILPRIKKLEVIRAVQTLADSKDDRFKNWFEALDFMKKEIDKKDFDIALIGCGAYGLPLAAYVKSIGKQGLHVGGGLQLFFGIKGKRWDDDDAIKYDKNWVTPMKEDSFDSFKKIEDGCYW